MPTEIIDISIIIPTRNRAQLLHNTLKSIAEQCSQPKEIIIIDGSSKFEELNPIAFKNLKSTIVHRKAIELGAATQRNQGINLAQNEIIGFFDDDILLEKHCIKNLFRTILIEEVGGVNAMIVNQKYKPPGKLSSVFYRIISGLNTNDFAGKCIGPVINFLPADNGNEVNRVDWLNTTCTLYKKKFLPTPLFASHLTGYSLMEDVTLSLQVSKKACLFNVRTARIFHDTQVSSTKHTNTELAEMDLVNRYFILTNILNKKDGLTLLKLFLQQLFSIITMLSELSNLKKIPQIILGKYRGLKKII